MDDITSGAACPPGRDRHNERSAAYQLRYLQVMEDISRVSIAAQDVSELLDGVVAIALDTFAADRSWFLSPCDPQSGSWTIPAELTRAEWPGLSARQRLMPTSAADAAVFSAALAAGAALQYGGNEQPVPPLLREHFSVQSCLFIALHPKLGSPWLFGLHHCAAEVMHDDDDCLLFGEIAKRVTDSLSSLLTLASLRESEARLRGLIRTIPDMVWLKSRDGIYQACNPAFERYFGASEAQIIGKSDYDFVDAASADAFRSHDRAAMAAGRPLVNEEWINLAADGRRTLLETTKAAIKSASGEVISVFGIAHDVTERRRAELREQLRVHTLDLLANGAALTTILHSIVQSVERGNPDSLCSILLLDSEGKHLGQGVAPSLPDFYNAAVDGLAIGMGVGSCGTAAASASRVIVEDIQKHPYWTQYKDLAAKAGLASCWSQPIIAESGKVLGTFAIYHRQPHAPSAEDIQTIEQAASLAGIAIEKTLAADALRASEQLWKFALEGARDGVWDWDISAGKLHNSRRWKEMLGYAEDEFGTSLDEWAKRVHPGDLPHAMADLKVALDQANATYTSEYRLQCKDGSWLWVLDRGMVVSRDADGRPLRLIGTITDITRRKQDEEALRQKSEALQRSNTDLEQFAYSVSHDMRQPLRMITGHLQLLERSLRDRLDEDSRENMGFAIDGAKRMDAMIVSLLEYSRVGRKTESKRWVDSRAGLDEALDFLAPAIAERKAVIKVDGDWPQLFASPDELTRLFQNLVGNALKFHDKAQTPRVDIFSVVSQTPEQHCWRVSIRDYGIGIDPAQIDRLFQFFSRLQSRARFEGTGMGLALCRRIVEHHQGRIWVESAGEGQGSTFIVELPITAAQKAPQ